MIRTEKAPISRIALMIAAIASAQASGIPEVTLDPPPALHVRLGPDSNACGITTPPGKPKGKRGLILWLHGGMRSPNSEKGFEAHPRLSQGSWDFLQGCRDRLFPADQVVPHLRRWEALHPNARLHYFPDGEHDFSFYAAQAPDLLKGLFSAENESRSGKKVPQKRQAIQNPGGKS